MNRFYLIIVSVCVSSLMWALQPTEEQRLLWSAEKQVTPQTPPCLLVGCQDDPTVQITNSIRFYEALTAHNVPSSLLIVPYGKHGWGFSRQFPDRERIEQTILSFVAEICQDQPLLARHSIA